MDGTGRGRKRITKGVGPQKGILSFLIITVQGEARQARRGKNPGPSPPTCYHSSCAPPWLRVVFGRAVLHDPRPEAAWRDEGKEGRQGTYPILFVLSDARNLDPGDPNDRQARRRISTDGQTHFAPLHCRPYRASEDIHAACEPVGCVRVGRGLRGCVCFFFFLSLLPLVSRSAYSSSGV